MTNVPLEYTFDSINIGVKQTFEILITEKIISDFANISGDFNPLHMDENFAINTKFKKRICHGMLISSFFSRLIGMYLPGKNSLYFSQSINFMSPCFIGDKIRIEGEVIDKSIATKIISIKTTAVNQNQKLLVDGIAKVLMMNN